MRGLMRGLLTVVLALGLWTATAPIAGLGFLEGFAIDSNHAFVDAYLAAGGNNGVFNFPEGIAAAGHYLRTALAAGAGRS